MRAALVLGAALLGAGGAGGAGPGAPLKPAEVACPVKGGVVTVNGVALPVPAGIATVTAPAAASYVALVPDVKARDVDARARKLMKAFQGKKVAGVALGAFSLADQGGRVGWIAVGRDGTGEQARAWRVSLSAPGQLSHGTPAWRGDPVTLTIEVSWSGGGALGVPAAPRCGN